MFNSLYLRVKFAFCSVVLGAIFALTGAAFAAEDFAVVADKNAAESGEAKIGEGFRYSEFLQYGGFNSSTKTDLSAHPFSLNSEPFDLPADEFGAVEGGGGLIEFLSSPLGGFVIAAGIFAGATAIDKNNRDDNTPSASNTPPSSGGENGGTNPTTPQQCTTPGEISDGSGGCRCDTANNYVDDGNGNCVMQTATPQCTAPGEIPDGSGGCQCDAANNYVDDGAGMCVVQEVCTGQFVADGFGGCGCPAGSSEDPPGSEMCVADSELALRAMCATDSALERRIFAAPAAGDVFAIGAPINAIVTLSAGIPDIIDGLAETGLSGNLPGTFVRINADGTHDLGRGTGLAGSTVFFRPTGEAEVAMREGDIVLLRNSFMQVDNLVHPYENIFRVYEGAGGTLFLARNQNGLATNNQEMTSCTAGAGEFFLDDNWMPTQNLGESRATFPFNLREGLRGLLNDKRAVRLKNFFFTANDSQLRDFHLEHRFHLFGEANESATGESPDLSGFSAFAESGYKRQNGGRTALHYNKLTAIRDFAGGMSFYAQGISGRINSEVYRNTRLRGFAAGIFADEVFRHNDSYHLRIESPLSAPQIARTRMAIDARIGEPENYWRIGFYRGLEDKKSAAKLFWLREF